MTLAAAACAPGSARAQQPAGGAGAALMPQYGGMYANPYANPYTNPFLNPYMTQGQIQGNAALYFFAAQQANGGIGSGQLSGTRPARRAAAPAPPPRAQDDTRRATDIPGAGAAGFFNRSYRPATSVGRYYNRTGRYHPSNAR
jgi:hypothetical protein